MVITFLLDALYLSYIFIVVDLTIFFTIARIIASEGNVYEVYDESDDSYDTSDESDEYTIDEYSTADEYEIENDYLMNLHLARYS